MNIIKYFGYLGISLIFLLTSTAQAKTTIDVMALYSPAVTATYGGQADAETTIQHMINVSNGVYSDSRPSDIELNLVHIQESALLDDNATSSTVLGNSPQNATFQALRNQYGADIVVMFRPYREAEAGLCGIAYVLGLSNPGFSEYAYAHVSLGGICPTSVTVHELGHTLGLSHSHLQDDRSDGTTDSRRSYGLGHGVNGRFATVMAYDFLFNTQNTVYKHSSPDLDCGNGFPCGVAVGQEGEAHAVLALSEFAPNVANYRESKNIDNDGNTDGGTDGGTDRGTDGETDSGDNTSETELEEAKRLFDEAKATFLATRDVFIEKRNAFRAENNDFRAARNNYRTVRKTFRSGQATRAELDAARAALNTAKTERNAARADLITYRNDTYRPARQAFIDARKNYRTLLKASKS